MLIFEAIILQRRDVSISRVESREKDEKGQFVGKHCGQKSLEIATLSRGPSFRNAHANRLQRAIFKFAPLTPVAKLSSRGAPPFF
jgi:hypothetical protein